MIGYGIAEILPVTRSYRSMNGYRHVTQRNRFLINESDGCNYNQYLIQLNKIQKYIYLSINTNDNRVAYLIFSTFFFDSQMI